MKCQVCGAESGKYPLCRACNQLKEQGIVIKCDKCRKWHYKNAPCPITVDSMPVATANQQYTTVLQPTATPDVIPCVSAENVNNCSDGPYLYAPKQALMTRAEQNFYNAIISTIPQGFHVYPQVNLATFIRRTDGAHYQNELYRNVDFLITNEFYVPRIVIEINDSTHMDRKRQERDKKVHDILEEAGIPIFTLWTSYGINQNYIARKIEEFLNAPVVRRHHFAMKQQTVAQVAAPQVTFAEVPAQKQKQKQGCYIATCVYGAYDCAPVWTLRRFRDETLSATWYGRAFIKVYYAISPTLVKWFGNMQCVRKACKKVLDRVVWKLNNHGYTDAPYHDKY